MNNKYYQYINENGDYVDYWTLVNDINNAYECIEELEEDNKQLKDKINKAIEYIESKVFSSGEIIDQLRKIEVKELLDILKGKKYEKEERTKN